MGNGFNLDISGIKELLNQIYKSKPTFPITDKKVLIKVLGGETHLMKINSNNETASAVLLAEEAFENSQIFNSSHDIIDGILGGSFVNALTKSRIYQEVNDLQFPVKHFRDLEKLSTTLQLYGISWDEVKERLDLPVNSPAEIVLAISAADPAVVGTDVSIIRGLELPDFTQRMGIKSPVEKPLMHEVPATPPAPPAQQPPAFVDVPDATDLQQPAPQEAQAPIPPPSPPIEEPKEPAAVEVASGSAGNEVEIKFGFSYLILEDKPKQCFEIFGESFKAGIPGICITRTHPRQIRSKFNLEDTTIHWLTDRKSSEEETISPALETMVYLIQGFVKKNDRSIIVLDGIEYLISVNKFNPVLAFIRRLVDFISERDATFLAPISPLTIGEQEMKTLEREMEPINENEVLVLPEELKSGAGSAASGAGAEKSVTQQAVVEEGSDSEEPPLSTPAVDTAVTAPSGDDTGCTPCESTGRCFWCSGTGKCESCQGTGKSSSGDDCENCNGSGICDSCKGTRVCIWCKGTGNMIQK